MAVLLPTCPDYCSVLKCDGWINITSSLTEQTLLSALLTFFCRSSFFFSAKSLGKKILDTYELQRLKLMKDTDGYHHICVPFITSSYWTSMTSEQPSPSCCVCDCGNLGSGQRQHGNICELHRVWENCTPWKDEKIEMLHQIREHLYMAYVCQFLFLMHTQCKESRRNSAVRDPELIFTRGRVIPPWLHLQQF